MAEGTRRAVQSRGEELPTRSSSSAASGGSTTTGRAGRPKSNLILSNYMQEAVSLYNRGKKPKAISEILQKKHGLSADACTREHVSAAIKYAKKNNLVSVKPTNAETTDLNADEEDYTSTKKRSRNPQNVATCMNPILTLSLTDTKRSFPI